MSVSNGQPANASTFNSAFVSRTTDTDTAGKLDLNNTDTASGAFVVNAQKEINGSKVSMGLVDNIASNGEITISNILGNQTLRIQGDSGAQTASSTPFGNSFVIPDGAMVKVIGQDDTNTVQILFNDVNYGCMLNGHATLAKNEVLGLIWNNTDLRWVEAYRSF